MATLKVRMVCTECGIEFTRSKARVNNHTLCSKCKHKETAIKRRETGKTDITTSRRKETCNILYGADSVSQHPDFSEKACQTKMERYGNRGAFQDVEFQKQAESKAHSKDATNKRRKTFKNKYGGHPMKTEEVKAKLAVTYKERTGYDNPMYNPEVKRGIVDKYGKIGHVKGYKYEGIHFDSSWELAYYIWLTDNNKEFIYHPKFSLSYIGDDDKSHELFPDFLVEGKFYELKGTQFFNEKGEPFNMYNKKFWWGKFNAMKDNKIIILKKEDIAPYLKYVSDKYGKKHIASFKER